MVVLAPHSEYGSFTSLKYPPKSEQDEVLLITSKPSYPYKEIGIIRIEARRRTTLTQINSEMLRKAKEVGADAVIDIQYSGGEKMLDWWPEKQWYL